LTAAMWAAQKVVWMAVQLADKSVASKAGT
jgi:hypothetical protein